MRASSFSTAAVLVALATISSSALAAPTARDRADARALVTDAHKAVKEKRWADAVVALKKADKLDPSLLLGVEIAEAQIGAGKLVEAEKTLGAAVAGTDAAPAARKAREAAKKALSALRDRIPTVKIKVKGASADQASTLIDGIEVDGSSEIEVNPGDHTIGATLDGFTPAEKEVHFDEGAHEEVRLKLKRAQAAPVAEEQTGSRVPGAVVTAIGGAGLAVGGIFGGLAFTATGKAKLECDGNVCPPIAANDIARAKMYGNVSTGAFIAGGAVAAAGVILLIVAPGGSKPDDAGKGAVVTPWIGPGSAGLGAVGRF